MTLDRVVNIADLRRLAARRLPRVVFDYIDGGAEAEVTLRANRRAFEAVTLRPRSAVATPACDLRTAVLGATLELPFVLAPVGSSRMFYPRAEEAAARAAGDAGTAYVLSTLSGTRLEDVKAATTGPAWYQVYLVGGRDVTLAALARARAAGFSAIVVTVDTPVSGRRERDLRNRVAGLVSGKLGSMLPALPELAGHEAGQPVAQVALAHAGDGGVNRDDERREARGAGPLDARGRHVASTHEVQLIPGRAGRGRLHVLEPAA